MRADIYRILQRLSGEISASANEAREENYDFTGKRLLIAEDNELNMEVARELCEHVGFTVECAYNGKEAVEKFAASGPGYYDAILMDVHMPVMNGNRGGPGDPGDEEERRAFGRNYRHDGERFL